MDPKSKEQIRTERLKRPDPNTCGSLMAACLWPKDGLNLGTLARTMDAVNGCMVVPNNKQAARAVKQGNTIGMHNSCIHYTEDPIEWLEHERAVGRIIVFVEQAEKSIPIKNLKPAAAMGHRVAIVLGHESSGIPQEAFKYADICVEIPMKGVGNSLNVTVAGSLVAYKLAGLV